VKSVATFGAPTEAHNLDADCKRAPGEPGVFWQPVAAGIRNGHSRKITKLH
jgi:hypothetical protein